MDSKKPVFSSSHAPSHSSCSHMRSEIPPFLQKQILWALNTHNVVILVGEGGSGKSTKIPQLLIRGGWVKAASSSENSITPNAEFSLENSRIAVTQTRRFAVVSIAEEISRQLGTPMGEEVTYSLPFHTPKASSKFALPAPIKLLTDSHLIREMLSDPLLLEYSVVMIDDAHERSLNSDLLMGLLKKVLAKRPSMRLIVSSSSSDVEHLYEFFKRTDYPYLVKHNLVEGAPSRWGVINDKISHTSPSFSSPSEPPESFPEGKSIGLSFDEKAPLLDLMDEETFVLEIPTAVKAKPSRWDSMVGKKASAYMHTNLPPPYHVITPAASNTTAILPSSSSPTLTTHENPLFSGFKREEKTALLHPEKHHKKSEEENFAGRSSEAVLGKVIHNAQNSEEEEEEKKGRFHGSSESHRSRRRKRRKNTNNTTSEYIKLEQKKESDLSEDSRISEKASISRRRYRVEVSRYRSESAGSESGFGEKKGYSKFSNDTQTRRNHRSFVSGRSSSEEGISSNKRISSNKSLSSDTRISQTERSFAANGDSIGNPRSRVCVIGGDSLVDPTDVELFVVSSSESQDDLPADRLEKKRSRDLKQSSCLAGQLGTMKEDYSISLEEHIVEVDSKRHSDGGEFYESHSKREKTHRIGEAVFGSSQKEKLMKYKEKRPQFSSRFKSSRSLKRERQMPLEAKDIDKKSVHSRQASFKHTRSNESSSSPTDDDSYSPVKQEGEGKDEVIIVDAREVDSKESPSIKGDPLHEVSSFQQYLDSSVSLAVAAKRLSKEGDASVAKKREGREGREVLRERREVLREEKWRREVLRERREVLRERREVLRKTQSPNKEENTPLDWQNTHTRSKEAESRGKAAKNVFRKEARHFAEIWPNEKEDLIRDENPTKAIHLRDVCVVSLGKGRHPVDIHYLREACQDYVEAAIDTVMSIHCNEPSGDILVFLTGQDEVEFVVKALKDEAADLKEGKHRLLKLLPLPLYAELPEYQQSKAYQIYPRDTRKVVCSTNIAEVSVTIENIAFVVDCGFVKVKVFNHQENVNYTCVVSESQASAKQRASRTGRTRPGKCYRLMTQADYLTSLYPFNVPEILRSDLSLMVLQLMALGVEKISTFEFVSPPSLEGILSALELLYCLGALDSHGSLTEDMGVVMADLFLPPMLSRMAVLSCQECYSCAYEALVIVAMLTLPFNTLWSTKLPRGKISAFCKEEFGCHEGDLLTLYNIYQQATINFEAESMNSRKLSPPEMFYEDVRVSFNMKQISRAYYTKKSLEKILKNYYKEKVVSSCHADFTKLLRLICQSLFVNAAFRQGDGSYRLCSWQGARWKEGAGGSRTVQIHQDSVLHNSSENKWIVYTEAACSGGSINLHNVSAVESSWLLELAPHFYTKRCHMKI